MTESVDDSPGSLDDFVVPDTIPDSQSEDSLGSPREGREGPSTPPTCGQPSLDDLFAQVERESNLRRKSKKRSAETELDDEVVSRNLTRKRLFALEEQGKRESLDSCGVHRFLSACPQLLEDVLSLKELAVGVEGLLEPLMASLPDCSTVCFSHLHSQALGSPFREGAHVEPSGVAESVSSNSGLIGFRRSQVDVGLEEEALTSDSDVPIRRRVRRVHFVD